MILPELAGFVDNIGRVEWLGFWRRKPPLDPPASGFWSQDPSPTAGAVGSGGSGSNPGRWGELGGWRVDLDSPRSSILLTSLFTKGMPLSLIILCGIPNLVIIFSLMKFARVPLVAL